MKPTYCTPTHQGLSNSTISCGLADLNVIGGGGGGGVKK
jgi:hypothetical protein